MAQQPVPSHTPGRYYFGSVTNSPADVPEGFIPDAPPAQVPEGFIPDAPATEDYGLIGNAINAWGTAGPHRVVEGVKRIGGGEISGGLHDVLVGAGITAMPMVAPSLVSGLVAAPATTILGTAGAIGAGMAGQQALETTATALGATEDQSALAGDVGAIGAGTLGAKVAGSIGRGLDDWWRISRTTKAANEALFQLQKAFPSSKSNPYKPVQMSKAMPHLAEQDVVRPIETARDMIDGMGDAISAIHNEGAAAVAPFAAEVVGKNPVADIASKLGETPKYSSVRKGIRPLQDYKALWDLKAATGPKGEPIPGWRKNLTFEQAWDALKQVNNEIKGTLKLNKIDVATARNNIPEFAGKEMLAQKLRTMLWDGVEARGVPGMRELRAEEGNLIAVRNAMNLRSEAGTAKVGGTGAGPKMRAALGAIRSAGAGAGATIGSGIGHPWAGAAIGHQASEVATASLAKSSLTRDELVAQAMNKVRALRASFPQTPHVTVPPVVLGGPTGAPPPSGPLVPPIARAPQGGPAGPAPMASHAQLPSQNIIEGEVIPTPPQSRLSKPFNPPRLLTGAPNEVPPSPQVGNVAGSPGAELRGPAQRGPEQVGSVGARPAARKAPGTSWNAQARASAAAEEADTLDSLTNEMVKAGEFSPPETIRAFLAERLAGIKELVAEAGEDTGLTLLQAIRKAGGISLAKETALKGEIKWMQEFRTSNFGTVRGVPGVFNDKRGLPIDGVMEAVQQNPEFASQFKTQGEFLNAVQRAAQKPDRTLDALKLLRSQTMREIDGMKAANAPPVVDADGDVRLPGDVGAVRAQEVKTPTFRAPQQASGGDFALGAETQFKAGDMVKLTVPTLNGPRLHMGTVTRIMPDGRVEVRMQQGGYETVTPADLTRK